RREMRQHSSGPAIFASAGADEDCGPSAKSLEFSITELAASVGMTPRALRFYERKGLISPRRVGRLRIYSERDRDRIGLILKGKALGFTLSEISEMIAGQEGSPRALRLTREKCLDQIAFCERQIRDLTNAIAELRRLHAALCTRADGHEATGP